MLGQIQLFKLDGGGAGGRGDLTPNSLTQKCSYQVLKETSF